MLLLLFFIYSLNAQQNLLVPKISKQQKNIDEYTFPVLPKYLDGPPLTVVRTDFTITLRDNVVIDAVKFIPQGTPPSSGWPTIIMVHGFGNNKETLAQFCSAQAAYGYYTMTFSVRGQGNSGGLSNMISRTEALDLIEIVKWVKNDTANGSNPNNILIQGGSQGGLLPFMAASMGQTSVGSLGVKTIISALSPPDFASSWIENGCIKVTLLWSSNYDSSIVRYSPLAGRFASWIFADNKEKWDSLAYWFPKDRDFNTLLQHDTTPMIIEGSWQDKFFNAQGIQMATQSLDSPYRMYLGAVRGHGSDTSATEDQWHMDFYNDWISYYLLGIQNGVLQKPRYEFASTEYPAIGNIWTFVHDSSLVVPFQMTTPYKLYFNKGFTLKTTPNQNPSDNENEVNFVTGGLTMTQAVYMDFTGPVFNSMFHKSTMDFDSDPLTQDLIMTGEPVVHLQYSASGSPFVQYNFQIFDVSRDGTQRLVTRANFMDRNYTQQYSIKNTVFNGQAHSHIFKANDIIRVRITNLDSSPEDSVLLGPDPFVLPSLIRSNNYVWLNQNTYISLPMKMQTTPFTVNPVNSQYTFELKQNYPNPFNPSTTISYTLQKSGKIQLIVYDILGREVKTLVDEVQNAGSHSILFNASNLASGIYFYKLSTSIGFQDVKRLVLVK